LLELGKTTAKNVMTRALMAAAEEVHGPAQGNAPVQSGRLRDRIVITKKKPNKWDAGKVAYSKSMRNGATPQQAAASMRAARKATPATFSEVFIGPSRSRHAVAQEFGTVNHPAQPFMRPAFDGGAPSALSVIGSNLETEIKKAADRAARKSARAAK